MTERPRVLLLIPHLGGGGAEQVAAQLARGLSREKYVLHLALITQDSPEANHFPQGVIVHALNAPRVRLAAFKLLRLVHRLKPDLILSGMAHLNSLVLLLRPLFPRKTRVLVRQNGTVTAALAIDRNRRRTRLLYRLLYHRADRIICQTHAMAKDLESEIRISEEQIVVLANPVDVEDLRARSESVPKLLTSQETESAPWYLLAVGRLAHEKGLDLLLKAFVMIRKQLPGIHIVIAGEGPEKCALTALCRELGIEPAVQFLGHVDRPSAWFPGALLYVLPSRHDAMPNALLEAAAWGLPIVSMPASEGLVDLLRDQPGVWLATEITVHALAASLIRALNQLRPGQRFPHAFIEAFRFQPAIHAYEQLIDATLRELRP